MSTNAYDEFENRPELEKKRARAIFLVRLWYIILTGYIVISLAILTFGTVTGAKARADLLDCTEPSGTCYQEGQKRTEQAVADIADLVRVTAIAAAYCANIDGEQSFKHIKRCTERIMGFDAEK